MFKGFLLHISLLLSLLSTTLSLSLTLDRRAFVQQATTTSSIALVVLTPSVSKAATSSSLADLRAQLKQARQQLDPVPTLIKQEKWDSVRAILIQPPISDCWAKTSKTSLLPQYAEKVGDAGGDELAALETREEIISHLRYLDMAVYNNVFNPIATEGTTGASKELVRSYNEDPLNEYKASLSALDEMIALSDGL